MLEMGKGFRSFKPFLSFTSWARDKPSKSGHIGIKVSTEWLPALFQPRIPFYP
jgi:hypothetical protein